jgi:hypothetical protein
MTALHCASAGGHVECVRLLLDRGAGVDVVSVSSWLAMRTDRFARGVASACGCLCVRSGVKATCCVLWEVVTLS